MVVIYAARWVLPLISPAIDDGAVAIDGSTIVGVGARAEIVSRFSNSPVNDFDQAAILASLSDDVTIRVAVHDEPLRGKDTASFLFGVLIQELAPFELTEEIVEGNKSVLLFETSLHGRRAHGLNVVGYQPGGLVGELTVFFRPLAAMHAFPAGMLGFAKLSE